MHTQHRIKGETALPTNTLTLLGRIGVTRAAKEIGTSTTTLHKARKNNVVSKVVETAAGAVLDHLSDKPRPAKPTPVKAPPPRAPADKRMFLLEVDADKARLVEGMAAALGAEITSS